MPKPHLPPDEHVVRYVRKGRLRRDEDDNVIGVLPQAFQHREGESYLSVTWLQHFSAIYEDGLKQSVAAIRRQLTVKGGDGFTLGQVDHISSTCARRDCKVRILHEPVVPLNTGHCAWRGLSGDDLQLLQILADEVFVDTRRADTVI